jgi:hypothetical protein
MLPVKIIAMLKVTSVPSDLGINVSLLASSVAILTIILQHDKPDTGEIRHSSYDSAFKS